jgi:hypothetical protein
VNLRVLAESDLSETLENPDGWGLPIELIDPDGVEYTKSTNDPEADLTGQILYDSTRVDPETGLSMIVHTPVISLRRTSLARVPLPSDKGWMARIPETPDPAAAKVLHRVELAPEDGGSIGFIRLYLTRAAAP